MHGSLQSVRGSGACGGVCAQQQWRVCGSVCGVCVVVCAHGSVWRCACGSVCALMHISVCVVRCGLRPFQSLSLPPALGFAGSCLKHSGFIQWP